MENDLLREGRGPGACRRTTSADSLQANTLVRLFAPQGQTLFAPRFRSTQPWSYAHNPAMPAPTVRQIVGGAVRISLRGVGDAAPYIYRFFSCSSNPSRGVT